MKHSLSQISPRMTESTPVHYVNYIEVSHTPYEFALTSTRIPASPSEVQQDERVPGFAEPRAVCQLLIPAAVIPGLVHALQEQMKQYERNIGHLQPYAEPEMH